MEKINLPKIKEEKVSENVSKIIIEPLFPGYGHTMGNSLRRVLLSSIPGAAVTSIRIEGAPHEFTSLPHVKEDLVEILLNIKALKIKSYSNDPVILNLSAKSLGKVTAAEFSKNSDVEILNPEQAIATLDKSAKFDMEVVIENDRGFRSTDDASASKEIGRILVDASFSPVERVKIDVENTRVGQMTNYDKLILEISTNGSLSPKEAIIAAANILIDHYKIFSFDTILEESMTADISEVRDDYEVMPESEYEYTSDVDAGDVKLESMDPKTKIEDIGLTPRTANALVNSGIKTLAGLQRLSELKLTEIKGLGKKGIEEIKEILEKKNENT